MLSLNKQVEKEFGNDPDFKEFYSNGSASRCDSGLSMNSSGSNKSNKTNLSGQSTETYGADKVVVDLDLIVEKWINFMWDKTKKNSKPDFEDLEIIINWDKVTMDQEDANFEQSLKNKAPTAQTLFTTYFTNKTDTVQEYSFKTERTTRQSCSFSFEKSFSHEKEGGLSIKLPQDIVEIGGGIRCVQSIDCGKDKTNEEEITWGVDSTIKVQPHSKTSASLVITEAKFERTFHVNTFLRGRLLATLNNRRENNAFAKSFAADITEIISLAIERKWFPNKSCKFEIIEVNGAKTVKVGLKGKCRFRLGIEQHVTLSEEKLKF